MGIFTEFLPDAEVQLVGGEPAGRGLVTPDPAATLALLATAAAQAQQGVSKTEVVVGSIQDLSGPLAG